MANRPSRLEVAVQKASYDGRFYGRYPQGNAPQILVAAALAASLATGSLTTSGSSGSAPAYFVNQADGTWEAYAGGVGQRLTDVLQAPGQSVPAGGWGEADSILTGFTGGVFDAVNFEYQFVFGGGHGDGANNGAYALSLLSPTLAWRRILDGTPDADLGDLTLEDNGMFADGRPRAMHASNMCWAGGAGLGSKVWFPMMCSVTSGQGGHVDRVLYMDRASLGAATTPLAWTAANIGPTTFLGSSNQSNQVFGFGGCVFDPVSQKLIAVNNGSTSGGGFWQTIPIGTGISTAFNIGSPTIVPGWMQVCPDLGIVIVGESFNQRIAVLTIATNTWSIPAQSGTGYWPSSAAGCVVGAAYIKANHRIVVADPHQTNDTYYNVQIPLTGSAYNPSGTFVWGSGTKPNGPNTATFNQAEGGSQFSCNKLICVPDMGNGQSALVFTPAIAGPTYIYKVPAAGWT